MTTRKGLTLLFAASLALSASAVAQGQKPSAETMREADAMTQPQKTTAPKPSAAVHTSRQSSTISSESKIQTSSVPVAIPDKEPLPGMKAQPVQPTYSAPAAPIETSQQMIQPGPPPIPDKEPEPQLRYRVSNGMLSLPYGTAIRMKLASAISSSTSKGGDRFTARVSENVMVDRDIAIPVGATVQGRVLQTSNPRRIAGRPSINLLPETVVMPDGKTLALTATVVDTGDPKRLDVDDEGRIKGPSRTSMDNVELAAGAGAGAVTGTIFGGGTGTLIGAGIGAAASTGHWLFKRHDLELPAGTELILEVSGPSAQPIMTASNAE